MDEDNIDLAPSGDWQTPDMQWSNMTEANNVPDYQWNPNYFDSGAGSQFNFGDAVNPSWDTAPQGAWDTPDLGQMNGNMAQPVPDMNWNPNQGGISQVLGQLFSNPQMLSKGLGALFEGMQNKKNASGIRNIVQQQQQRLDPFGAQRAQYQQALSNTIQDPYSQPMVKDQVAQLARAQAIKDAAAGRRSNGATSEPALLAAQAQIAQNYMNSLMTPSGANISPSSAGLSDLVNAQKYNTNGYLSPLMSVLGYGTQNNSIQAQQALLQQLFSGGR